MLAIFLPEFLRDVPCARCGIEMCDPQGYV